MWCHWYCLFATVNYLTGSWLVSQLSWRIQQSYHEADLTHSPKCTLREQLQEALLMVREEEAQSPKSNQGLREENRDKTVMRVKRFWESDSFHQPEYGRKRKKKANPKLQNLHSKLSPQQSSNSFERKVPCPVHPFLASNSLALQVLTSLQGTALPGYWFSSFPDQ